MLESCSTIDLETAPAAVPVRCFTGADLAPDEPARRQLRRLASAEGLARHVAVLPDVHVKSRNPTPTGTVAVTRGVLYPRAIDEGVNCGMRSMVTEVPAADFGPALLDDLYRRLLAEIPLKEHEPPLLSAGVCADLLAGGLEKAAEALELPPDELARTENGGRAPWALDPGALRATITAKAIAKGLGTIGTIGAGNHFLELQEVAEVLDGGTARALGVEQGAAVFMLHTDSRRLAKKVLAPVRKELEPAPAAGGGGAESGGAEALRGVSVDSEPGRRLLCGLAAAMHAGYANRAAVTSILRRVLREVLRDPSLNLTLLYDCGHESILPEEHGGERLWVHRHGASHAMPPGRHAGDPVLRRTGQPVPIAGCMGSDSYLAVARPGVRDTFDSVAHGAGRVLAKADAARRYDEAAVEREVASRGVRLYRYHADEIAGQAPASFKDVTRVIEAMAALDLIRPVARLRPLAVLKG